GLFTFRKGGFGLCPARCEVIVAIDALNCAGLLDLADVVVIVVPGTNAHHGHDGKKVHQDNQKEDEKTKRFLCHYWLAFRSNEVTQCCHFTCLQVIKTSACEEARILVSLHIQSATIIQASRTEVREV